jgi:lysophospholipase L1-like esterase
LVAIAAILWFLPAYLHRRKKPYEWLIIVAVVNLVIVVPELALRVTGFSYESRAEFRYPRTANYLYFQPDEKLFWKLKPSYSNVNSLGFPGKEVIQPKPAGVFRALFLGDSVTAQGFPTMVEHFLNAVSPDRNKRFETVTLAVVGYSSYQGAVIAEMYGTKMEPDLAVVFFGWNDHWQAFGAIDSERQVRVSHSVWSKLARFAYHNSLLVQVSHFLIDSIKDADVPPGTQRVPIARYVENLRRIKSALQNDNVPVLLITAPTSHYRLGVPDYLVDKGFVPDKRSAIDLHKSYNQSVRQLAESEGLLLLDLEAEFDALEPETLRMLFLEDGIHLTKTGTALVAKRVSDFIEKYVSLAEKDY